MTKFSVWAEGYRKVEDAAEIEADDAEDAVQRYCDMLFREFHDGLKSRRIAKSINIYCQAVGFDEPLSGKRYFYTCPIKAAFMAKHHGVCFDEPLAYGFHNGQYCIARSPHLGMSSDTRYYIHPDSVHLLKALPDDVILAIALPSSPHIVASVDDETGKWSVYSIHDNVRHGQGMFDLWKIIQRNGEAFFWPESEEA